MVISKPESIRLVHLCRFRVRSNMHTPWKGYVCMTYFLLKESIHTHTLAKRAALFLDIAFMMGLPKRSPQKNRAYSKTSVLLKKKRCLVGKVKVARPRIRTIGLHVKSKNTPIHPSQGKTLYEWRQKTRKQNLLATDACKDGPYTFVKYTWFVLARIHHASIFLGNLS